MFIGDFHIHGRFSRACSNQTTLELLEQNARKKGIHVLGTGDFTHPKWLAEIKNNLIQDDDLLRSKSGYPFILQTEISLIYTQENKSHRVHHLILAPSVEIVDQIVDQLSKKGNLDYDGRPIFGFSSIELVDILRTISNDIEIIPAHAWTPWFSIFGSKSGWDSIEECFKEKSKFIHAIETGLSSDPAMNWRISFLDNINLVSFSDAHSFHPWRLGREATLFEGKLNYNTILKAIRTGNGLVGTIEVDPNYGKYHYDGHRNCGVVLRPEQSKQLNNICPKCGQNLTIGVLSRILDLSTRKDDYKPLNAKIYHKILPLSELIASYLNVNQLYSKKVNQVYEALINKYTSEFNVLLNVSEDQLRMYIDGKLADLIIKNRLGRIPIEPGFDGEYGKILLKNKKYTVQKSLEDY